MIPEPLAVALKVVEVFEELGIRYHVGGSFASSIHGVPRQTHDIDLVADLVPRQIPLLVPRLQDEFYIDAEMIRSSLRRGASFNLVHLESGFKVDIFPLGTGPFDRSEFRRHASQRMGEDSEEPRSVMVKSPEDTLLRKLQWYRLGREVSDRQWSDILGIVRTQAERLDVEYLETWAVELGIADLLERALLDVR